MLDRKRLLFFRLVIFFVLLLFAITILHNYSLKQTALEHQLKNELLQVQGLVETLLSQVKALGITVAALDPVTGFEQKRLENLARNVLFTNSIIANVALTDNNGKILFVFKGNRGEYLDVNSDFLRAVNGRATISPFYLDAITQEEQVAIYTPIIRADSVVGVLVFELPLARFRDRIEQLKILNKNFAIFDSQGTLLYPKGMNVEHEILNDISTKLQDKSAIGKSLGLVYGAAPILNGEWSVATYIKYAPWMIFDHWSEAFFIAILLLCLIATVIKTYTLLHIKDQEILKLQQERKAARYLKNVLDKLPIALLTYDLEERITYLNESAERLTDYHRNGLRGIKFYQVLDMILVAGENVPNYVAEVLRKEHPIINNCFRIKSKKGKLKMISADFYPFNDLNGQKVGVLSVLKDRTSSYDLEILQKQSHFILNSSNAGIIAINSERRITQANKAAIDILGITDNVIGKKLVEIMPNVPEEKHMLSKALREGHGHLVQEVTINTPSEEKVLLSSTGVIKDSNNRIIGAVGVFTDVTNLRREQKSEAEKERLAAVGQIAAGVAHEIRNPLTSIRGFTQLLQNKMQDPVVNEYLGIMMAEITRCNEIITDFLQFARPNKPEKKMISLVDLVSNVAKLQEANCEIEGINLQLVLPEEFPDIQADAKQITQVLLNFTQNSIQAMRNSEKKKLILSLGKVDSEHIYINIEDTGCGIPQENIGKLGIPFFTTKNEGTGLGLSVSYKIIEQHGGKIEVVSDVGKGTTFKVIIPINN